MTREEYLAFLNRDRPVFAHNNGVEAVFYDPRHLPVGARFHDKVGDLWIRVFGGFRCIRSRGKEIHDSGLHEDEYFQHVIDLWGPFSMAPE